MVQGIADPAKEPSLVNIKCSRCHTLKRVFIMSKTVEEWHDTVEKMMNKNPKWISPEEAIQIVNEILNTRSERIQEVIVERMEYEDTRSLLIDRCTICHTINRILLKDKTAREWEETVDRMRSEASGYITQEDAERISRFLSQWAMVLKEDAAGTIFVTKCLICHPGEQILLVTHTKAEWEKLVKKMQMIARDTLPMARISYEEAKLLVDLLVKTQGSGSDRNSP